MVEWKYIVGIPGIPDDRFMVSNMGDVMNIRTGTILSKKVSNRGYLLVHMGKKFFTVHRLVAIFFVPGKSSERTDVNHIDGCKINNIYTNLEWVSKRDNIRHAYDNGLINIPSGEESKFATILESEVDKICKFLLKFDGNTKEVLALCNEMGIKASYQMIQQIKHKQSWVEVSDKWFDKDRFKINHFTEDDVRKICESLVRHNGSAKKVLDELKDEIPVITYVRIHSIKMKLSHVKISDEYFKSFI